MNANNVTGFVVMIALVVMFGNVVTAPTSKWPLMLAVGIFVALVAGLVTKGLALLWQRTRRSSS